MADSLDDFFAKKDRSKKSKGKKVILPVAPSDLLDDSEKYPEEDTANIVPVKEPVININVKLGDEEDGEWKEFDEEKDYSGLKIQAMTIKDKEEEKERERQQEIHDQESKKSEGLAGPWKVSNAAGETSDDQNTTDNTSKAAVEATKPAVAEETDASSEKVEAKPAAYIPPSLRNRMAASSSGGSNQLQPTTLSAASRKGRAPAIDSQQDFPSLGQEASSAASIDSSKPWRSSRR